MPMDRREFLGRSVILLAGWSAACAESIDDGDLASPALLTVLGTEQVRAIGRSYREMVPAESDSDALRSAILDARERAGWGRSATSTSLDRSVRADFEQGRTVVVNGWILSVTEARQCALHSLLSA